MTIDWPLVALVAAIFAFAGWIKGVIGLGLPTIATGLMGIFIPPAQAAAIVVVPALVTNVWQMLYGGHFLALVKRLWPMLLGVICATVATAGVITGGNVKLTVGALGLALMAYAGHQLLGTTIRTPERLEPFVGALAGITTGVISGFTGVFVVPTIPFLQTIDLGKDEMIQAIGITAFTSAFALMLGLGVHGGLRFDMAAPILAAVAAGLVGMWLGQILRAGLTVAIFRRWVLIGLIGLGASMAARALS
jgi:uncharacterized membrane protein YfcA